MPVALMGERAGCSRASDASGAWRLSSLYTEASDAGPIALGTLPLSPQPRREDVLPSLVRGTRAMGSSQLELFIHSRLNPDDGLLRTRRGPRFASCFAPPSHLLGASGARRCGGLDCAPWSLRPSSSRPRATAAAATRARWGLRASCLRAPRLLSARRRLSSVSGAARVPPSNPQVSERA